MGVFLREFDGDEQYLAFGPDRFRHGNQLDQDFMTYKFVAEYATGDHIFKAGFEREEVDVDNLFAQNSEGSYVFDSIDDLRNATASGLLYNNAVTNDENDLRAIWGYNFNSLYIQDSWDVNGYLTIDAGLRYDWYESEGSIRENQNFVNRYGYSNANDIDGLNVFLPRISFEWLATEDLTVRGGLGRFSGGAPGVWISNSYSNDGVLNIQDDTRRVQLLGADAVAIANGGRPGYEVTQELYDTIGDTSSLPDDSTNVTDPNFEMPSEWKYS
jgi:hypothetical protein